VSTAAARTNWSTLHLVPERPPGPGLTDYALWMRANGCSATTIEDRLAHVAEFARHHLTFPAVTPMDVTAWLGREGYKPASRATYFGTLRSYFTYAMEFELLTVDPMGRMRRPRVPKGKPRPLTADQVEEVLAAATNPNLHAWLILALFAGLRAHEIAKLKGEDVDQVSIHVLGKGGNGAFVPTHPRIWALALERPRSGWWFPSRVPGGHVSSMTISTLTTRLFAAHGIPGSIHRCRHTFVITPAVVARGTAKSGIRRLVPHEYMPLPRHVRQGRDQALSSSLPSFGLRALLASDTETGCDQGLFRIEWR
jgi:integrase/recombinase XerD